MDQLTAEQIKTFEDAFSNYPEDFPTTSKYASMKGIQEQLDQLEDGKGNIFYISKVSTSEGQILHCTIEKVVIGEE